jgi:hypothetical protein
MYARTHPEVGVIVAVTYHLAPQAQSVSFPNQHPSSAQYSSEINPGKRPVMYAHTPEGWSDISTTSPVSIPSPQSLIPNSVPQSSVQYSPNPSSKTPCTAVRFGKQFQTLTPPNKADLVFSGFSPDLPHNFPPG